MMPKGGCWRSRTVRELVLWLVVEDVLDVLVIKNNERPNPDGDTEKESGTAWEHRNDGRSKSKSTPLCPQKCNTAQENWQINKTDRTYAKKIEKRSRIATSLPIFLLLGCHVCGRFGLRVLLLEGACSS